MQANEKHGLNELTLDEIQRIEGTDLSAMEKHYLRVLAYSLVSFKSMSGESKDGSIPNEEMRLKWLLSKEGYQNDEPFVSAFLNQLITAANQLEHLADYYEIPPLQLTLDHLIGFIQKGK